MTTSAVRGSLLDRLVAALPVEAARAEQLTGLIREARSFGMIGAVNAVADILLFTLLHVGAGVGPLSAKVVSGIITIIASYYANRRWTWPHRPGREQQRRQLIQFSAISSIGLLLAEACLGFSHYVLGLHSVLADNVAANFVGLALGMVWRFYASRRWIFTTDAPAPAASRAAPIHRPVAAARTAPAAAPARFAHTPRSYLPDWAHTMPMPRVSLDELLSAGELTSRTR